MWWIQAGRAGSSCRHRWLEDKYLTRPSWGSSTLIAPAPRKAPPLPSTSYLGSLVAICTLGRRCLSLTCSMAFYAALPLPTTVAFLFLSSPWLGPTPPLLSPSVAALLLALPAATKLIRRTEQLVRKHWTGITMQTAVQLQDLIDRDLILEDTVAPLNTSYSLETVRATLASLCPPASHRDTLTSAQLASIIAQSTPLTVSAGDVMAVLDKLSIGAAAGASGSMRS